jgi:SAM-dependent methyltransferase
MHLIYRNTCRICGSTALTPVCSLGDQHLQGSFAKPGKELPSMRRVPLNLLRCDPTKDERACGLLQLAHSTPPDVLYAAYWYRSGVNNTMRQHLRGLAEEVATLVGKPNARVLDIGCNDGTLLSFYPASFERYGVDPSDIAQEVTIASVVQDLFPSPQLAKLLDQRPVDIITSIACFYDLEEPVVFAAEVKRLLAPEGIWVFEMSYMPKMLEMNSYDTICHEHLEYYSLAVLKNLLGRVGLRMFRAEENDINGGSIRCYATHDGVSKYGKPSWAHGIAALQRDEFDKALDTDEPYRAFQERVNAHRDELHRLVNQLKSKGKSIHVYGASTKGNTILQWCGIDHRVIDCAADRNPDKHGAYTLGTNIPIVSEEESRARRPDYYLVLPWHFRKEFVERERAMIEQGVGLIFPLPTIEVVRGP